MSHLISLAVVDGEPRIDSRVIAKQLGVVHKNTRELIEQYQADLEEFGVCPFETAKPKKGTSGGRPEKFYLLNEDQAYLLLTYSQNTEQARELKKRLVRAFGDHRRAVLDAHTQPLSLPPPSHTDALAGQLAELFQGKVLVDYATLADLANTTYALRHMIGYVEQVATRIEQQIGKPLLNRSGDMVNPVSEMTLCKTGGAA